MRFVPRDAESCELVWTFAVEPNPFVGLIIRTLRGPMGRYFGRLAKRLDATARGRVASTESAGHDGVA